mmetsp:Transcript_10872/g.21311  ORF Transcript_10872/g.21311 Transcript_10872/m.21311 type:complete len:214 (-) Transcript_10872:159-800(-)
MGHGLSTFGDQAAASFVAIVLGCAVMTPDLFDLKKQFAFYASYHTDHHNQLVHFACIWPIYWSTMAILHKTTPFAGVKEGEDSTTLRCNWATVATAIYAGYYLLMDRSVGAVAAGIAVGCYYTAGKWVKKDPRNFKRAIGIKVAAWIAQFLSHRFCEGRAPALLDNLSQALLMAPLFVVFEGAQQLGFRPEFFAEVQDLVSQNLIDFRKAQLQ